MRALLLILLVFGLCAVPGHLFPAGDPQTGRDVYLDLPDGFGWSEEEEDTPELIPDYYDKEYEGDAFFFCLDRSSTMGQLTAQGNVKFDVLKRQTINAITALSSRSVVSIVFYDRQILVCGDPPVKMDAAGKGKMIGFVSGMEIGWGTCHARGAEKCLSLAEKTRHEHRTMIFVSDGRPTCPDDNNDSNHIFQRVMSRNTFKIPINTIYTGPRSGEDWNIGMPLLKRIALATTAKFTIVD